VLGRSSHVKVASVPKRGSAGEARVIPVRFFLMDRENTLKKWLETACQWLPDKVELMAMDASFRRYFRVWRGQQSYVAMDAPPERENNTHQFVAIAQALRALGLEAPEVLARDRENGFLLLTDLGDRLYLQELQQQPAQAEKLYSAALQALAVLQSCRYVSGWTVPMFSADFMYQELQLFKEWFLQKHLQLSLTAATEKMLQMCFHFLAVTATQQPQVFMHRDYHSANLLVLPENKVGILDFQDAFIGPVTYDLVSLLRDCYIAWPDALVKQLVLQYKAQLNLTHSDDAFLRDFDLMGVQRHLKALLTFSRKYRRDDNANYLQHIPRTLNYVLAVTQHYPECQAFNHFLNEKVAVVCVQ
jgi:aminoglycoside/choline kinase family phosphotransferase